MTSTATVRVMSAEEIAAQAGGETPFVLLPERATLFAERAMRLRQLASGHAMGDFLLFMAEIAMAQHGRLTAPDTAGLAALTLASAEQVDHAAAAVGQAAKTLRAGQGSDGAWRQLPSMESDAYATGLALWALHEGGVSASTDVYRRGLRYLLGTQSADGTWRVKTRSLPVQPYFESGYPYVHDQWISAAAASYATMAIAAAVEPQRAARR